MVALTWRRLPALRQLRNRPYSSVAAAKQPIPNTLPSKWLPDLKKRLGKCIIFGLNAEQTNEAGSILRELARSWRTSLVGSEGFVAGKGGAGLENHRVAWGDMV